LLSSNELVNFHSEAVYKLCRSLTFSKEDADDLFQETFLKAFEHLQKTNENPQGFLFSTAIYIWKSWKRKYARRNRLAPVTALDENTVCDTDIEKDFTQQEDVHLIRRLVDALPEKFKIPTILYYSAELGVSDIAATLKLPVGTVKSRLHKARKLIEEGLVKNGYEK